MIPAEYYSLVYILIVIAFAIPVCNRYQCYSIDRVDSFDIEPIGKSLLFTILIIVFVAVRPNSPVFADGPGYWYAIVDHRWEYLSLEKVSNQFATKYLIGTMSMIGLAPRIGFFVYAIIVYGFALLAMRKLFPRDTLLAMILYCGTFTVFGLATNGIKNGMALSLFLCALAYKENFILWLTFLVISIGFHHSMQISIAAFILCCFYKNTKHYYVLWIIGALIATAHISYFQNFFAGYTDESGKRYLITNADSFLTGFRPDFMAYSAAPLAIGWWIIHSLQLQLPQKYKFSLNVYLVTNTIWLLCMYSSFTNRIATLSWNLFPILLLSPFLTMKVHIWQFRYLTWVVYGQLGFTLLMTILSM